MTDLARIGFAVETSGIVKGERALDSLASKGEKTERRLDKSVKTVNNDFMTLKNTIGLAGVALTALGSATAARDIIKYSDSWKGLNSQLRQVTESEQELISVRERLLNVSRDTRTDLTSTVELYAVLDRATTKLGTSTQEQIDITRTLNNMFLASGKTAEETAGAITQLSQGLESGALRGDEFNSVAEGAPRILDALAASTGMARGELRAFAATGGITAEVLVKALGSYSEAAQKAADMTELTFGQSLTVAAANATEFAGQSELLNNYVGALGETILSASQNLDSIADATKAALTVGGAYATLVGGKYVAGLVAAEVAIVSKAKGLAASTAATAADAAAEVNHLRVQQAAYANTILRIKSETTRNTVRTQLTATTAALTAAESRLAAAHNAEAVAASKATASNIALNRARSVGSKLTALALGPWGLLAAAVGAGAIAFMSAKDDSDKLSASLDDQSAKLARLNSIYGEMTKSALEDERNKLLERSNEILFERLDLEAKINETREKAFTRGGINTDAYDELNKLKDALSGLNEESKKIDQPLSVVLDTLDELYPVLGKNTENTLATEKANKKAAQSYAEMVKNLENQRQQLILNSDEFEIYMVMQQASANQWSPAMTEQIVTQTKALQDQRKAIETTNAELEMFMSGDLFGFDTKESSRDLDDLINQVDNFGGAWTNTGNVIADTFGNIADSITDYSKRVTELNSMQSRIDKERQKSGADTVALNKLQLKVNDELAMAEIDNYQAMAGAAAGMFSEKTAAAKAFNAINQALAIAEIALSYQKIAAGTTETAAHVANEGTKQSANALTAITSAFAAPFPVNFAMGTAMIGIMSSLIGGSFGGSGSSYEMPEEGGTGTVLGDPTAQSASLSNVSAKYEDLQLDQLAELKGIRNSITKLNSGIQNLAQSFITDLNFTGSDLQLENSNFLDTGIGSTLRKLDPVAKVADWIDSITGDFLGLGGIVDKVFGGFSSKKQKLIDSGITFMSQTMAGIFESGELEASMYNVIETTKKKFWGLSKKTSTSTETQGLGGVINEQMGEIFGYLGESVIAAAESLGMDAKHIITTGIEGLGLEDALKTFVIDIGDVSFLDKTGEEVQKELEAIFSQQGDLMAEYLVPSIKEYQQVGEGAFETLQRVAYEQAVFNDSLERTGKSLSELSNLIQIDVAQSVITMIGGIENFAELSNKYFEVFYSESQQFDYLQQSLSEAFGTLGLSIAGSREEFKAMIDGIDLTTEAGQRLYASLLELVPGMDEYLSQLEDLASQELDLQIQLLKEMGRSEEALALERERELAALDESLRAIMQQIYTYQDLAKAVNYAKNELEKARDAEIKTINAVVSAAEESYNETIKSINLQREAYYQLIDELESAVASSKSMLEKSRDAELARYDDLIAAAKDASSTEINLINSISSARISALNEELSIVSSVASQFGAASIGVSASDALTAARMGNFEPATRINTGDEYSSALEARIGQGRESFALAEIGKLADSRMSDIERSILATESSAESQISAIESASNKEVEALQAERDAVEARILEVLGIDTKALSLDEAVYAYQKAQDELANAMADGTLLSLQAQEDLALQTLEQIRSDAEKQINALNEQVDLLLGIDESVLSVEEAIKLLMTAEQAVEDFEAQTQILTAQYEAVDHLSNISANVNELTSKYANIDLSGNRSGEQQQEMINEIKALRSDLDNANAQIGENTARTASSIRNLEYMQSAIR